MKRHLIHKIAAACCWLAILALAIACQSVPTAPLPSQGAPAGPAPVATTPITAAPAQDQASAPSPELILAAPRDLAPGQKDPYYCAATLKVWESLVTVDEDWMPAPGLAEAWEQSEDGLAWTFHLRRDVVFSDGSPLNADAVLANVERNRKISPRPSPFYSFNADTAYGDLKMVEKVDEYAVRFVHNTPQPAFPAMIATYFSAIFAPSSFDENGDFIEFPIASGPFRVVEHVPDQYVVLEPNPLYRGEAARAQRIRIRTIPDPNTRASALRAGEIHGVLDLGAIQPAMARELVATGEFQESSAPIAITHYVFVNGTKAPWDDPRLHHAVSLALDREFIVNEIFLGYGVPAGSMLNMVARYWHDASITLPYDPEQAVALARAVLGDKRLPALILIPSYQINRYPYKALGEYVQAQIRPLGIDAEIRILEGPAFSEATAQGQYDLALRIQGLWSSDPASLFDNYLGCDRGQNKTMSLGVCDEEVEQILQELRTASDLEQRKTYIDRLQAIAARELPVIPLFYEKGVIVFHKSVEGYELSTNGGVSLERAALR